MQRLREWARRLKLEIRAVAIAYRSPQTPWFAKLFAALVVAYALSPIDLIPDFIPVLGYLDDLLILPLGLALAIRLTPDPVMQSAREQASKTDLQPMPCGVMLVLATWFALTAACYLSVRYVL